MTVIFLRCEEYGSGVWFPWNPPGRWVPCTPWILQEMRITQQRAIKQTVSCLKKTRAYHRLIPQIADSEVAGWGSLPPPLQKKTNLSHLNDLQFSTSHMSAFISSIYGKTVEPSRTSVAEQISHLYSFTKNKQKIIAKFEWYGKWGLTRQ